LLKGWAMSYDLYFEAASGKGIDRKSFAAYFKGRPNYQAGKGQAIYQNEDTGVYFIFDEPAEGAAAFNLNYFRPHVFAIEAAIELEKFDKAFGMTVIDPQGDAEEPVPFSKENFFKGWKEGNKLAYKGMLKEHDKPPHAWPAKKIRAVWEWNYNRGSEQERVGENLFVPAIFAIEVAGRAVSVAVWPSNHTIVLPEVDMVLVPCDQKSQTGTEAALERWEDVHAVVKAYQEKRPGLARYRLDFKEEWPPEIAAFLGRKRQDVGQLTGVGMDELLDKEWMDEALKG
jgi:hypothetical protein